MTAFMNEISHREPDCHGNWRKTLAIMAAGAVAVMIAGTYWDVRATAALTCGARPSFNALMGRTIFEGDLPGANDLVSLLFIVATVIYIYSSITRDTKSRFNAWRPQAGFVLTSGLVIGLFMVHGLKYLIGRARPSLVLNEAWPYSSWFVFGPHTITDGIFNASFPSGHTAQAFVLMSVAYILAGDPQAVKSTKTLGWIWGAIALLFSAAMGAARCASSNHWLTDVLGSICMGWLLMHWIYFGLLRMPEQRRCQTKLGHPPLLPPAWELMLCIGIFFMGLGTIMAINSLRGIIGNGPLWFGWLIPAGVGLAWIGSRVFRYHYRIVNTVLRGCDGKP